MAKYDIEAVDWSSHNIRIEEQTLVSNPTPAIG